MDDIESEGIAPEETIPEELTFEETMPEATAFEELMPDETMLEEPMIEEGMLDETMPKDPVTNARTSTILHWKCYEDGCDKTFAVPGHGRRHFASVHQREEEEWNVLRMMAIGQDGQRIDHPEHFLKRNSTYVLARRSALSKLRKKFEASALEEMGKAPEAWRCYAKNCFTVQRTSCFESHFRKAHPDFTYDKTLIIALYRS